LNKKDRKEGPESEFNKAETRKEWHWFSY